MTAPETDAIEILVRLATDDNSHVEDVGRRAIAQLTALRARLEAAEADTKRLDFVEGIAVETADPEWGAREIVTYEEDEGDFKEFSVLGIKLDIGRKLGEAPTLRAAVDAARATGGER